MAYEPNDSIGSSSSLADRHSRKTPTKLTEFKSSAPPRQAPVTTTSQPVSSMKRTEHIILSPLDGLRVLACLSVLSFHVFLVFLAAGTAWRWYDILDVRSWPHVACGPHFMLAMHVFLIMTGFLAASSLSPSLTAPRAPSRQVITRYWAKRVWRILPAYYVALLINAAVKTWPSAWSNPSEEAVRVREYFDLGLETSRAAWSLPLLISNVTLDMRSFLFAWNIPIQMQFYLLLPMGIIFLRPHIPSFRQRLGWTCALAAAVATIYRVWVVFAFSLQAQLPIGSSSHAASHDAASVAAAWSFLMWLYASFMSRMADFSLGILLYLITSSDRACAFLRSHARTCTAVSAAVAALAITACFGEMNIRPQPGSVDPIAARLGIHIVAGGVVFPAITAWLMLYILVCPDQPSKWIAAFLGSPKWAWPSARSYSVFLLHPFVAFGLFQAIPVTSVIGPLEDLSSFVAVCGLVTVISFGLAWLQDVLLKRFVQLVQHAARQEGMAAVSVHARCIQPAIMAKGASIAHAA